MPRKASSRKVHCVADTKPLLFAGEDRQALCGDTVKNPRVVARFNLQEEELSFESVNTIMFCDTCLRLALTPTEEKTWIYFVMPGQQAHEENLRNRTED